MVSPDLVREFFEKPESYLKRPYNIRIRSEAIRQVLVGRKFENALDIGCGDGSISIPLLSQTSSATLIDFSTSMISLAQAKLPPEFQSRVSFMNCDFMNADFPSRSFDLALGIGILAHIANPSSFISKVSSVLKPGGILVLQNFDSSHPLSKFHRAISGLRDYWSGNKRKLNYISSNQLISWTRDADFELLSEYRYAQMLPGTAKFLRDEQMYGLLRKVYGSADKNRLRSLGNESIYFFQKKLS